MYLNLHGPLEQFEITPLISLYFEFADLSITKGICIFLVAKSLIFSSQFAMFLPMGSPRVLKSTWQHLLESIVKITTSLLYDNLGREGEKYSPFVFSLFMFVTTANLIGLIPYSFTMTSHLVVTFSIALSIFIGINFIGVEKHGTNIICLFLPAGTSFFLALLLVPIEIVSYIFKPISLSVRLFANMMAGHTLTHVIAGFSWSLLSCGGIFFIFHTLPLVILILLMGLEFAVALIQAYVFSVLSCIYLNDVLRMH